MRSCFVWMLALGMALGAAPALAAPAAHASHAAHAKKAAAKKPLAHVKAAKDSTAAAAKASGPRTLQDIHIEGEIPTPQVLFITARDQRRFVDFQTQRYLKTSKEVGDQTVFPSRIVVTGGRPADEPKEQKP
jgi:hypothetical protein